MLVQEDKGRGAPVAFASASEKNYSQLDKEGLAIIFAVDHFNQYIAGKHVTIITDHQSLLGESQYQQCCRHIRHIDVSGLQHMIMTWYTDKADVVKMLMLLADYHNKGEWMNHILQVMC